MRPVLQALVASWLILPLSLLQPDPPPSMLALIVQLDAPPAAAVYGVERTRGEERAAHSTRDHVDALERRQDQLTGEIEALDGVVWARMQRAYNGLIVSVPARRLAAVRALNGVQAVYAAARHRPLNARSVREVNAPQAWTFASGLTGRGQKIAIVDTGIDYTHADFGGQGTLAAWDAARRDQAVLEPGSGFPSAKMPGGIDLVGDGYNADNPATSTPVPDPDPLDCYGHGTHVAGTAAGYGVAADGTTYRGPYSDDTPFDTLRIGPGVAPEAAIFPVKIFGCTGSTIFTPLAIEWAIDPNGDGDFGDRMDVVNLSLGSPFGSGYDASTVAANNAALAGVVVVASAGNDGDTTFATSTPGTADRAIAVAASGGGQIATFSARGPRRGDAALKPDLAAPGSSIYSAGRGRGDGGTYLSGTSMAAPHVAGAAALVRQQHPAWSAETVKAALLNTAADTLSAGGGVPYSLLRVGAGVLDVGRAVRTEVVAYGADEEGRVSLSFGRPAVLDRYAVVKHIRLVNHGDDARTYTVRATQTLTATGVVVRPLVERLTLQGGASATIPIMLDIADARDFVGARDATMTMAAFGERRHMLGEVVGTITFTPADPDEALHVPYFAAPRRAANMAATAQYDPAVPNDEIVLRVRGTTSLTTTLASLYELQHRSPKLLPSPIEQSGVLQLAQAADLQYVGVASDFGSETPIEATTISFGVATYAPWSTPSETTFVVEVDVDRDGIIDHRIRTVDGGPAGTGGLGDVFWVEATDLDTGRVERAGRVNYVDGTVESGLYGGRVAGFAVSAEVLGLSAARTQFDYRVTTHHVDAVDEFGDPVVVDSTPTLRYDAARQGFQTVAGASLVEGTPLRTVTGATSLRLPYDGTNIARNRSAGLLVLHHTNTGDAQAQEVVVRLEGANATQAFLPSVRR
jgi:subtilisin family serine protease